MPRVNKVEHARKAQPNYGINKGDTYYWWKFRYGGKHVSKTYPRASQLTQSKLSGVYAAEESAQDEINEIRNRKPAEGQEKSDFLNEVIEDLKSALEQCAESIREVAQEYTESADNMESGFGHETSSSEEVREKASELESYADDIESNANSEVDGYDPAEDEEDWLDNLCNNAEGCIGGCPI